MKLSTGIGRLRLTGLLEGLSYILLLGIAMPLKYYAGMPQAVRVIGMAHGILFILFLIFSLHSKIIYRWSITRLLALWLASIVPFGTFYVDYTILRQEDNNQNK
jgi:integral membrane protein